jgi:hypothetical protein
LILRPPSSTISWSWGSVLSKADSDGTKSGKEASHKGFKILTIAQHCQGYVDKVLDSTCFTKIGRNKFGSRDRLIDISIQLQKRLDEVCALCGYHTRKHNGIDNK